MKIKNNENRQSLAEAKTIVIRYLKYRPRSEREIIEKLRSREFCEEIIQQTVAYLKRIGEINDKQFAAGWARSRLNKPFGINRIRMELKHKGIDDAIIAETLNECCPDRDEYDAVLTLAQQQWHKYRGLDQCSAQRRLYHYLLRRGFKSDTIMKALRQL